MSFSDSELVVAAALDADVAPRPRSAPCRALPTLDLDAMTAEAVELFRKGQQQVGKLLEMLKCLGNLEESGIWKNLEESGRIWETYGDDWEKRWEKLILDEKNQAMGMSKGVKYL